MARDKYVEHAKESLYRYGWVVREERAKKTKNGQYTSGEKEGEPDLIGVRGKDGVFIEAKTFGRAFNIKNYREEQIKFAEKQLELGVQVWIWFTGGDDPPNYNPENTNANGDKYRPRRVWLVPYGVLKGVLHRFESIQKSIPYGELQRMAPEIRKHNLTFVGMFGKYQLKYSGNNQWDFYREHPFAQYYMPELELDYLHSRRFKEGDPIMIVGYQERFVFDGYGDYNWEKDCWNCTIRSAEIDEVKYSGVAEDNIYLRG